jgi:hypothetical protein
MVMQHSTIAARTWGLYLVWTLAAAGCGVKLHPYDPVPDPGSEDQGGAGGGTGGSGGKPAAGNGGRSGEGGAGGAGGAARSGGTSGQGGVTTGGGKDAAAGASGGAGGEAIDAATPAEGGQGGGQPSGVTVSINGMDVPKEKAIVFIHIGHSDMAGRALEPASLKPYFYGTDPHLWVYAKGGKWKAAMEPTAGDGGSGQGAGPGMAILRTALGYAPDAFMISIGHGQSGAASGFCPNFRKGQVLYPLFMDAAKELKGKVTFGGIFTMLGITEYHLGTPGLNSFADCLVGIANDIRADLEEPDLPLMVGGWNMGGTGIYDPNGQYGKIIRPQMDMVPTKTEHAAVIPTDGFPMHDDRHLNMQGHKMWAELGFKIMSGKTWLPWATTMP